MAPRMGWLLLVAGCVSALRAGAPDVPSTCPPGEPANGSACGLGVGSVCTYSIAAVRTVHCHCVGPVWDCGPPLGIDSLEDAPGCPARAPSSGQACTLRAPVTAPGVRPGCRYQVPATTILHDCACAHFTAPARAAWDCGPRVGDGPYDARGCPARQPAAGSRCVATARGPCQYGFNLSTTCQCAPMDPRSGLHAWRCQTQPQLPSPGAPP